MVETHTTAVPTKRLRFGGARRSRTPTQITALDIDGSWLRVATGIRRGDRVEFSRVATAPLSLAEDADVGDPVIMGEAIRRALDSLKLKPGTVAMAVPRREAILRAVSLPASDDDRELASMVQMQVGRDLPYRREDAVIDFEPRPAVVDVNEAAPKEGEPAPVPKMEVLVAVAQKRVVEFYKAVCAAAGLKLGVLTFAPYANVRALQACGPADQQLPMAIVSARSTEVTVEVVRDGRLLFSRDATLAEEHHDAIGETETVAVAVDETAKSAATEPVPSPRALSLVERITIEVVRSLHAFGGMAPGTPVARVVVAGGTGREGEVAESLAKRFNVPAVTIDCAKTFEIPAADQEVAPSALAAMGTVIATSDARLSFNFLDPKRPAVQRDMRRIRIMAAAAVVLLLFLSTYGVRTRLVNQRLAVQKGIQEELTKLQKSQPLYRKTRAQAASIQEWMKEGRNWLDHYAYLTAMLPGSEELYVTSLTIGSQGNIRLAVQARNGEVLARLDKQLRDAGYEVKPQAITPGTDRFGYDFRSSVELIIPPKMKIDLSKVKKPPGRPADDVSLNAPGKVAATSAPSGPTVTVYGGGQ